MASIQHGQKVTFFCRSFLADGSCLDSEDNKPVQMIAGNTKSGNEFSKAVANSLIKMSVNETKHLRIPARLCFGDRDPKKIFKLTLNSSNAHYRVGDEIKIKVSEQEQTRVLEGTITKIDGDHAHVDTNHPLAGENLVVKVQIVSFC